MSGFFMSLHFVANTYTAQASIYTFLTISELPRSTCEVWPCAMSCSSCCFNCQTCVSFITELTDEQENVIEKALRPYPPGEVLVSAFKLDITRKDIATLSGLNWLNDEVRLLMTWGKGPSSHDAWLCFTLYFDLSWMQVVNFYMELLTERGRTEGKPKVHAFNTFFYERDLVSALKLYKTVRKKVLRSLWMRYLSERIRPDI